MRDGYLRGALSRPATPRQMDVLAAYVAAGGSVPDAADLVGIRPSTVKRHLADLRARSGLTTEQLIYAGRAKGWLLVPELELVASEASEASGLATRCERTPVCGNNRGPTLRAEEAEGRRRARRDEKDELSIDSAEGLLLGSPSYDQRCRWED